MVRLWTFNDYNHVTMIITMLINANHSIRYNPRPFFIRIDFSIVPLGILNGKLKQLGMWTDLACLDLNFSVFVFGSHAQQCSGLIPSSAWLDVLGTV